MRITIIGCGNSGLIHAAKIHEKGYKVGLLKTSSYNSEYFEKNNTDKGPVRHRAEMFNKRFIWYTAEEPLFEKLEQAFRDLLGALKTKK